MKSGKLPKANDAKTGVLGSAITVNKKLAEALPVAQRPIPNDIKLHTLLCSAIPRKYFGQWTRWYQEDGKTQIFRLFKDEENRHNDRPLSARVEAFTELEWTEAERAWHDWSGVVTGIKPCGSILQVKSDIEGPAVMVLMSEQGIVKLNHRRGEDQIIAKDMLGKPFLLAVRDNGRDYEVYLNGAKVGSGSYARPKGKTSFRWGMYVGENPVKADALLLISGATVDWKQKK